MRRRNKALLYMALAILPGLCEATAVWANRKAWPDQFEIVALSLATVSQALLALKAYYSDPNPSLATDRHGPNTDKTKATT